MRFSNPRATGRAIISDWMSLYKCTHCEKASGKGLRSHGARVEQFCQNQLPIYYKMSGLAGNIFSSSDSRSLAHSLT